MLSLRHEFLVELFRQRPKLALELLGAGAGLDLAGATVERASIDLTQVTPTAYRSDALTVTRDRKGAARAAVIAEVPLHTDKEKRRSWPLYVAAARASFGCPALLLVFAPDPKIARWAARPIELGHPGFCLRPIVLGYKHVPRITDEGTARAAPELAVLSTLAHPKLETVLAARAGLGEVSKDLQKLYWDFIMAGLPALVRQALEARMIKGYQYQSDFARKYYNQGRKEGREEGREAGREEGREALRSAIVELVCARLPGVRDELTGRLRGLREAELVQLAAVLGRAPDEAGVRAALDQLVDQRS